MTMTPEQKIKHAILVADAASSEEALPEISADNVDAIFEDRNDDWQLQDAINEFRQGQVETPDIKCEWSRNYETKSVAAKMLDGSWVGWTYWYGGGKHGEPETIDWMGSAYDLKVTGEKVVTTLTFEKVEH